MKKNKRQALEAAGWVVGDAGDLFGLSEEERRIASLRADIAIQIRKTRKETNVTQKQLAERIGSSQSRVAKIEAGSSDVSLDLMLSSLFAMGCEVQIVYIPAAKAKPKQADATSGATSRPPLTTRTPTKRTPKMKPVAV